MDSALSARADHTKSSRAREPTTPPIARVYGAVFGSFLGCRLEPRGQNPHVAECPGASGRLAARRSSGSAEQPVFGRFGPFLACRLEPRGQNPHVAECPRAECAERPSGAARHTVARRPTPSPSAPKATPVHRRAREGAVPLGGPPARPNSPFLAVFGLSARAAGQNPSVAECPRGERRSELGRAGGVAEPSVASR